MAATQPTAHQSAETIENVQTLRALAALLVVFVHMDVFLHALGVEPFGYGGVDLFFVISGYIMVYTTSTRPVSPRSFLLNRFVRIAPIYWLMTVAVSGVALVAPSLLKSTDPVQLLKSLLFIPFEKPNGLVQPVLFVGWTLNYEMFFYVLFAIGLAFGSRKQGLLFVSGALLGLVLAGPLLGAHGVLGEFYSSPLLLEFAAGMALARVAPRLAARSRGAIAALYVLCAASLLAAVLLPFALPTWSVVVTQGVPAAALATAAISLHQSGVKVTSPLLSLLGDASYSIYLTHPFVVLLVQKVASRAGLGPWFALGMIPVTLTVVCVIGVIAHKALERPLTKLVRGAIAARGPRRIVPPIEMHAPR